MTPQPPHMEWLCSTPLMDLEDPALRLRVQGLTQLKTTRRAKVLAVYAYVKRLKLRLRVVRRHRTATEVLRAGGGDAAEKATLFVAMLRLLGVPARMRSAGAGTVPGFGVSWWRLDRPVVEAWTGERWAGTDTYILDPNQMAAARQRLRDKGQECRHGIHVRGATTWDGLGDAYASGHPPEQDPRVAAPGERTAALDHAPA
ncbi:MAG: transglutaminase domain-containing protein [Ramlibacter sp.]